MKKSVVHALALACGFIVSVPLMAAEMPAFISAAVNDSGRPAADKARDADRKPAEILSFAQIKPGQKIAEMLPGGGYFTRIFSKAVGPRGQVYVFGPPGTSTSINGVLGRANYANVSAVTASAVSLGLPEPVDIVWTSLNYHDLKNPPREGGAPLDMTAFNKAIYNALIPGGYYVVIDHSAAAGDTNAPSDKHRIDQLVVVTEVTSVGFLKQAETQTLRRASDPRTESANLMNGLSDQFVMIFRKPDLSFGGALR